MNKVASYLQEHLRGEVLSSPAIRRHFANDAGVLTIAPHMVVYPKDTNDIRKMMRFSWQLAERGHVLPVTARGYGASPTGASLGSGAIVVLPAYMNRLLEVDTKQQLVRVQPGINYQTLQEVLYTHQRFLPPFPCSINYTTIGGAIATNVGGEKSIKYGEMAKYVDKLEVVLANGELIQTGRISKRDLNRKMGETTFEAEMYRQLDGIITDNWEQIQEWAAKARTGRSSSGYNLGDIKHKDGSFDLTPLFVGSEGTLGIVTEAILKMETHNPKTQLILAEFADLASAHDAISEVKKLAPSALEMVDKGALTVASKDNPKRFANILAGDELPAVVLLIEFDDPGDHARKHKAKKALKLLRTLATKAQLSDDYEKQQRFWDVRDSIVSITNTDLDGKTAVPVIEDAIVPLEQFEAYIQGAYALCEKYRTPAAIWGQAGEGNFHVLPLMNLSRLTDRQHIFKLMEEYYDLVLKLGGSTSAGNGDGRLRAPFAGKEHGETMADVFAQIKKACDPYGILNPGVKIGATIKDITAQLRKEYDNTKFGDYLPRI